MIIGISSTGKSADSAADQRFGRCSAFAIYDSKQQSYRFINNEGQAATGGAGIAAAQQMVDEDVEIILTGNMGPNAFNVVKGSDIKIYRIGNVTVEKAVQLFLDAKLENISEAGAAHFGMGGGRGGF